MKLVAVTSCPTGIAHTYIAAEKLTKAGLDTGVEVKVETQGSAGTENELTAQEIMEADGVIIAADKGVDKSRFAGKPVYECGTREAIKDPVAIIRLFQDGKVASAGGLKTIEEAKSEQRSRQNPIYRHLMSGVSFMIPFVVIGGLMIAIALAIGGEPTPSGMAIPEGSFWQKIQDIGATGFMFMVPILAAYIAYSIADRPGIAPGMIAGYIAANGSFYNSEAGAGFIGGIVAGFLAGYVALWVKKWKVPRMIQPIMPILVIPIIASLVTASAFIWLLGRPIAAMMGGLTDMLNGMQGGSAILLALILGAMIAFDMGGPFNKVAFLFGASLIGEGNTAIMGAIAAAICTPPLGMGIASLVAKKLYSKEEQEAGKAALAMGLFGITEGAIPFAASDPLRVIPSLIVGAMVASALAMMGGVGDSVPHGGPIVAVVGAIDNIGMFALAIIVGTGITALMVNLLKARRSAKQAREKQASSAAL
ncbi:PTS fructose transporter subunit IIBC [Paenibacillus sp. P96]|uniref:PTS fructose transporter subunit IIBC n=1 Tax=Paenibacillus zeirhizosphaerae TaxID=2987519 RepID=A0ABT9FN19_9BACL|nr:PTS fructose transporter subunit IIBC [Paenibacillus sp. P96]MDP4096127.1 PTS fructose transporter subunit IIBC [Paenibacillus sp. P96]